MPKQDLGAHIAFKHKLKQEFTEAGARVFDERLTFSDQAKLGRAGKDGTPITGGISWNPNSSLLVSGSSMSQLASALTQWLPASAAPGPRGVPLNMQIEVRQIMSAPPKLGWQGVENTRFDEPEKLANKRQNRERRK